MTYHPDGERMPLTIQTSLGIAMVMPVKYEGDPEEDGRIVIEVGWDNLSEAKRKENYELRK